MNKIRQMCYLLHLRHKISSRSRLFLACKLYTTSPAVLCSLKQHAFPVTDAVLDEPNVNASNDSASGSPDPPLEIGAIDINLITGGDAALEKKYKRILLLLDVMRQEGFSVPTVMNLRDWKDLLAVESQSGIRKYFMFLYRREMKRNTEKRKKEEKSRKLAEYLESKKNDPHEDDTLQYGLGKNSIFIRFRKINMNYFYNWKLLQAMMFSQEIVLDCGYDDHMVTQEAVNCAKQLTIMFSENRHHINPFNVYLCNVNRDSRTMKEFSKNIPTCFEPHFPLNITEKSYLDIFPKERLVYLTPHCREVLHEFDHDAIYIIGAFVDKQQPKPLSLAKAKEEGLKMAKLPVDTYVQWGDGSGKSLTLDQMINIMLDIRCTGDWRKALKHVPTRKLTEGAQRRADKLLQNRIQYKLHE